MYRFQNGGAKTRLVMMASIALALLAFVVLWVVFFGSQPQLARDYEECVEQSRAPAASSDERGASISTCSARFAGRRKVGGGYTYYDFMQDRNFDIAGPNPTAEERMRIDREYMGFLDVQRREAISAQLAKKLNEKFRADMEGARQPAGPPMVLTPRSPPSSAEKRPVDRPKSAGCADGSLACSWSKLSAVVKNAFASSPKTKH